MEYESTVAILKRPFDVNGTNARLLRNHGMAFKEKMKNNIHKGIFPTVEANNLIKPIM